MSRRTTRFNGSTEEQYTPLTDPLDQQHTSELPSAYWNYDEKARLGGTNYTADFSGSGDSLPASEHAGGHLDHSTSNQQQQQRMHLQGSRKRRVDKACDICRVKKTKCDGSRPCSRCFGENRICSFTDRRKSEKMFPQHHVEMLETRVKLLSRCLDGLFAKAYRGEDVSYMVEKDGSLAINVLMKELRLNECQNFGSQCTQGFDYDSDRKGSIQSVESQNSGYSVNTATGTPDRVLSFHESASFSDPQLNIQNDSNKKHHYQKESIQTNIPIQLAQTIFSAAAGGLPPFEDMHAKHHFQDDFVFEDRGS